MTAKKKPGSVPPQQPSNIIEATHPDEIQQSSNIIEATHPEEIRQPQPLNQVLNAVYSATSVPPLPPVPCMSTPSATGSSHSNVLSYPDISSASKMLSGPRPPIPERSVESVRTTPTILLAGLTGSGKSTLISHLTKAPVRIGHDLNSCTSEITTYTVNMSGQVVRLIDTPGFDDTNRSDSDILGVIALTLAKIYEERIPLLGVVYLHRISDPRVGGASRKSVRILEAIVGAQAFERVLVATTMWDKVSPAEGEKRERELVSNPDFFGTICHRGQASGAMVLRHTGTRESAERIIKAFISRQQSLGQMQTGLLIQQQLVDKKLSLEETNAGRIVDAGLRQQQAKQQEELKELEQALKECKDDSTLAQLKDEHKAQLARVQELGASRQGLKGDYKQLVERLIPPLSSTEMENISNEDSIAISEIMVLKDELNTLKRKLQFAQDNQTEQEIALLQMKEEQRHQRLKAQAEQQSLRVLLQREYEEKQEQLARKERHRERKRLEKAARHGRNQVQTNTFLRCLAGPGFGIS
ncbi:hypothetical protein EV426DRAFT_581863 [Tirmania nivea]|nr:hypothetical protein EV426DRAFT_581863 [Tirmania nivea]